MKKIAFCAVILSTILICIGCTDKGDERATVVESPNTKVTGTNALAEITKLAESGDAVAQSRLGNIYAEGSEVPQDFALATQWFNKAAEQGDPEAQYYLGVIYSGGFVAPPDYFEGYVWFCLAAKSGFETAGEDCEAIASELSPEELVAAKSREAKLLEEIQQRNTK